jgi:hypothetical protein
MGESREVAHLGEMQVLGCSTCYNPLHGRAANASHHDSWRAAALPQSRPLYYRISCKNDSNLLMKWTQVDVAGTSAEAARRVFALR